MTQLKKVALAFLFGSLSLVAGCHEDAFNLSFAPPSRGAEVTGDYTDFLAVATDNQLVPGDVITVSNDWGGYYFTLADNVTSVRISITGAAGSQGGASNGGTGGTGEFDMSPSFLLSQRSTGFWVVLGQSGRPSAGETSPITNFVAFNGGGAGTDWSDAENTYDVAAGGGGASDVRISFAGDEADPHAAVDACAAPGTRFAIVGGGGGGTDNDGAVGGFGGGFNNNGGDGDYQPDEFGTGATTAAGGNINGATCRGGNGLQDDTEGWAGGGGGGYFGGGAAPAHGGGGGGSGFLFSDPGLSEVGTSDGTQGGNATTNRHGAFTITVL